MHFYISLPLAAIAGTITCLALALLACLALDAARSGVRSLRTGLAVRVSWGERLARTKNQSDWRLVGFLMALPVAASVACGTVLSLADAAGLAENPRDMLGLGAATLAVAAAAAYELRRSRHVTSCSG